MYDETNVPPPEVRVRPVVRYLVTTYYHPYMQSNPESVDGKPFLVPGGSKVLCECDNEAHAEEVVTARLKELRTEPEMVPADPQDMNQALVEVANALDCECNLEDMLHAIDALRMCRPIHHPPKPPSPTVLVRNGVPINPEAR